MGFKRFSSGNTDYFNGSYVGENGELTWDSTNGLRLHDGNTEGGNTVGGTAGALVNPGNASGVLTNDGSGNLSWVAPSGLPAARTATNTVDPTATLDAVTVRMTSSGNVQISNLSGSTTAYAYTAQSIISGTVTTIVNRPTINNGDSVDIATLAITGDSVIFPHIYEPNSGRVYRVTAMVGWSGLPHGMVVIERIL